MTASDWLMVGVMAYMAEVTWLIAAFTRSMVAGSCAMAAGDGYMDDEWSRPSA
jgi:outer membrane protease